MMELTVVKTGAEMFDACHACGIAVVLATASQVPVELRDQGLVYRLYTSVTQVPKIDEADLLAKVLALPTLGQLSLDKKNLAQVSLSIANFDGLLAALFTVPGVRLVSVYDMLDSQRQRPTGSQDGLNKTSRAVSRWEKYLKRVSKRSTPWLALRDYDLISPTIPFIHPKGQGDLTVLMTIDPYFGYSSRRTLSDGLTADKTNMTIHGARYAVVFALVGAARFLRAQRVANKLVNLYIPLANKMMISAETALPLLDSATTPSDQAVVYQWLTLSQTTVLPGAEWKGLAYQTLQTQGASQSISLGRGYLDYPWLNSLKKYLGTKMINYWKLLLSRQSEQLPFELNSLIETLLNREAAAWLNHLRELSICSLEPNQNEARPYTFEELKEVTQMMVPSKSASPLSAIIESEEGTIRFGRALRLLSRVNNGALTEIIEDLDAATTLDQLTRIAATISQVCEVASAKSKFIIVPNETDLKILLDDIELHSPRRIANLLICLSFIRYPGSDEKDNDDKPALLSTTQETEGEKE